VSVLNGAAIDFTLRIAAPQLELAASTSTPILPPVGTPGASTRGADIVTATLASLGIGANGACTILGVAMLPQNAPAGTDQVLVQIGDGSDANRFRLRNAAGGATILAGRVTGGVAVDAASLGSMTAGTPFRVGVSIDGTGRIASCLDGGAVQVATGGPTSGLTTLWVGNNAASTAPMFGEVGVLTVMPLALADAELQARVAALPL
jgi:hypothetical protein